ncbi:MAG: hypothetical protein HYT67_00580 [Candidatus Yanofskybacteria bacterium]|nr:hypothetical protein [Candidatus Yanofskybacteria bacterium]
MVGEITKPPMFWGLYGGKSAGYWPADSSPNLTASSMAVGHGRTTNVQTIRTMTDASANTPTPINTSAVAENDVSTTYPMPAPSAPAATKNKVRYHIYFSPSHLSPSACSTAVHLASALSVASLNHTPNQTMAMANAMKRTRDGKLLNMSFPLLGEPWLYYNIF